MVLGSSPVLTLVRCTTWAGCMSLKQVEQTIEVPRVLIGEVYWQGQNGKFGMISATEKAAMQFRSPCKLVGISCLAGTAKHSRNSAVSLANGVMLLLFKLAM